MTVLILNMPDDEQRIPAWIEDQIVGTDLRTIVSELATIHGSGEASLSLDDVLGEARSAVLAGGLSELAKPQWQSLLTHPQLLLDLQEEVAVAGGNFWHERATTNTAASKKIERTWAHLANEFQPAARREDRFSTGEAASTTQRKRASAIVAAASILAAACLLVWFGTQPAGPPPAWGWQDSEILSQDVTAPDYLQNLATAANDWFNRRPATADELAIRIGQFRSGCSLVMLSEHWPLADEDRRWLVDRCRVWATKLDDSLARLEAGGEVNDVRAEVDKTVARLVKALQTRAEELADS